MIQVLKYVKPPVNHLKRKGLLKKVKAKKTQKMMETKKIMMNEDKNRFETGTLKGRMKEILSISFFALIAVFVSILLSDIIFFPIAYYSVRNVDIFNILFKYTGLSVISILMITLLYFKVRSLNRDGYTAGSIIIYVYQAALSIPWFFYFCSFTDIIAYNTYIFFIQFKLLPSA